MADTWVGLCKDGARDDLRRALRHIDAQAHLVFAESSRDLRLRMQETPFRAGALVGPCDEGVSPLNIAAALVRDGMAADVVLVVDSLSETLGDHANLAGIQTIVDLSTLPHLTVLDLDEPMLSTDDVPTMVLGSVSHDMEEPRVARVDKQYASDMITLPLLREGAHGPEVEHVQVSRDHLTIGAASRAHEHLVDEREDDPMDGGAPIITFVSGRGGVGKTALVAMVALVAARWNMRVALCDLDLSCGNLYSCFGRGSTSDLAALIERDPSMSEIASQGEKVLDGIDLWGPCARPEMAEMVFPHVGNLLDALVRSHDLVLVDTSTTFTDAVAQAAQQADRLVIVVDDRPGTAAAEARMAALAVRLGIARTRIMRLANRCGPHGRGEPIINRAEVGLETVRPLRVFDGGPDVRECMAEGSMGDLVDLGSRFAESAAASLAQILSELGKLPDHPDAQRYTQHASERSRWTFGRRREAM